MEVNTRVLIDSAIKAKEMAYAPYSDYKVGAAVLTDDGKVYAGCNIENASYGATNCAERTAIYKAVSEGSKCIKAVAVAGGDKLSPSYPCGICRQVISEFASDKNIPIYIVLNEEEFIETTLEKLLPHSFKLDPE